LRWKAGLAILQVLSQDVNQRKGFQKIQLMDFFLRPARGAYEYYRHCNSGGAPLIDPSQPEPLGLILSIEVEIYTQD